MERLGTYEKIASFMQKEKQPYEFKRKYAQIRAKEFATECDGRGLNYHVSVGGLDSIILYIFLHEVCGIDVPGVSASTLEDKSIQRVHKALGIINGPADSEKVKAGLLKPYVGAYTQIDFSRPCPSIFDTSEEIKEKYGIRAVRPLAPKTMERIARGLKKFVIDNAEPFVVQVNHSGAKYDYCNSLNRPLGTITGKHGFGIVEPILTPIIDKAYGGNYQGSGSNVNEPIDTITTVDHNRLVVPTLIQYHSETAQGEVRGQTIKDPIMTVDSSNRYGLVTSFLSKFYKTGIGQDIREPLGTVTANAGGGHFGEVRAFLIKYYGDATGQDIEKPLDTVTTKDRFGLVTIEGVDYQIVDIGLRMLEPRELYGCQGFPDDYIIDHDYTGKTYPRSEQVRRCGNAVCPPIPAAMVKANLPELCVAKRTPNMRVKAEQTGQLRFA